MKALIKQNEIIPESSWPEWLDPVAFAVFDCYGYYLCPDCPEDADPEQFEFKSVKIKNPYHESDDDPETVTLRTARFVE